MSRFYTAPKVEYEDDFIFQPDWELAKQAAAVQDEIAEDAISTMDLMSNPMFEFNMKASGEAALEEKMRIEEEINDIARKASSISDPRELQKLVRNKRRELE